MTLTDGRDHEGSKITRIWIKKKEPKKRKIKSISRKFHLEKKYKHHIWDITYIKKLEEEYGLNKIDINCTKDIIKDIKDGKIRIRNKVDKIKYYEDIIKKIKKRNKEITNYLKDYRSNVKKSN